MRLEGLLNHFDSGLHQIDRTYVLPFSSDFDTLEDLSLFEMQYSFLSRI